MFACLSGPSPRDERTLLATSGGRTAAGPAIHPVFFDGFLGHPEQAAAALLAVAKVARTRFYTPPGMLAAILRAADPVVTSNGDRLRFESPRRVAASTRGTTPSPEVSMGNVIDTGTTNVDFNLPMRDALARTGGLEPLHPGRRGRGRPYPRRQRDGEEGSLA